MPLLTTSTYKSPYYLFSNHLETIVPNVFRKINSFAYSREKLTTSDQDFIFLDWLKQKSDRLLIMTHGLEGNSDRLYMRGMADYFYERGWDVLAWNCRSCTGEMNKSVKMYHHGEIQDLTEVLQFAMTKSYKKISLVGFSMGGSIILKYLGVINNKISGVIKNAVAISVPCNLKSSASQVERPANKFYLKRFFKSLINKIRIKARQMPELLKGLSDVRTFEELHKLYTIPVYGFKDTEDFYRQASAENYLKEVTIPTLVLNAKNDPMLSTDCFPGDIIKNHPNVFLEAPDRGGHVGFTLSGKKYTWAEERTCWFLNNYF